MTSNLFFVTLFFLAVPTTKCENSDDPMEKYKISALAKIEKLSGEVNKIVGTIDKDAWNTISANKSALLKQIQQEETELNRIVIVFNSYEQRLMLFEFSDLNDQIYTKLDAAASEAKLRTYQCKPQ